MTNSAGEMEFERDALRTSSATNLVVISSLTSLGLGYTGK